MSIVPSFSRVIKSLNAHQQLLVGTIILFRATHIIFINIILGR